MTIKDKWHELYGVDYGVHDIGDINWMDFRDLVPRHIDTVILPVGTIEPHGVFASGADNIVPLVLARSVAREIKAMVAPAIAYGVTGPLDTFPGAFSISIAGYRGYVRDVLSGLADTGFRTIVVMNGHGVQTGILDEVTAEVGRRKNIRILVMNWWIDAADITMEVFGEHGRHGDWSETAIIQAIDPELVRRQRHSELLYRYPGTYSAYPPTSSIMLYRQDQGRVQFNQIKADEYLEKVTRRTTKIIMEVVKRWDDSGAGTEFSGRSEPDR